RDATLPVPHHSPLVYLCHYTRITPLTTSPCLSTTPPPPRSNPRSLHDALPISVEAGSDAAARRSRERSDERGEVVVFGDARDDEDLKSTRLNSSHLVISYAVFCLKKKKKKCKHIRVIYVYMNVRNISLAVHARQ